MTPTGTRAARAASRRDTTIAEDEDRRIAIYGVSWDQYETVRTALDDVPGLKMTYLEGTLEIMSPGRRHEAVTKLIARLVEIYALERRIPLTGGRSTTFRKAAKERGLEPDECYSIGAIGEVPELAIEVAITSGIVNKLDVYEGLRIPEVWLWKDGKISVHRLGPKGYERRDRSVVLPELDLPTVASLVASSKDQTETVIAFRDLLRKGGRRRGRRGR